MDWTMMICIINLILTCVSLPFIIIAIIGTEALKRSTHKVQFIPAESLIETPNGEEATLDDAARKKLNEYYSNDDDGFINYENF